MKGACFFPFNIGLILGAGFSSRERREMFSTQETFASLWTRQSGSVHSTVIIGTVHVFTVAVLCTCNSHM